jgi:hypothetical protein
MGATGRMLVAGLGIYLLGAPAFRLLSRTPHPLHPASVLPAPPWARRTPFDRFLWCAWRYRTCARLEVTQELDNLETGSAPAPDTTLSAITDPEVWRLAQMARDRSGDLNRARAQAKRAASLAHAPAQHYRAARLLAQIDHEAGRHREELKQARFLVRLDPQAPESLALMSRAVECNRPGSWSHAPQSNHQPPVPGFPGTGGWDSP